MTTAAEVECLNEIRCFKINQLRNHPLALADVSLTAPLKEIPHSRILFRTVRKPGAAFLNGNVAIGKEAF